MIIVEIIGGLGNQMFQYSLGRYLAEKNNMTLKLDVTAFANYKLRRYELEIFNIIENFASAEEIEQIKYKKLNSIQSFIYKIKGKEKTELSKNYIQEKHFHFDPEILDLPDNVYLSGYWQSEKYFKQISKILRKEFTFKKELDGKNKDFLQQINGTNSVSLHIRKGDYVSNPQTKAVHGVDLDSYYKNAINLILEKVENPHFYIFSDEPVGEKGNSFIKGFNYTVVNCNSSNEGYKDLALMSNCKHNILANSSFSWWGAWLNNNPEKIVIAPEKWFNISEHNTKDLIPASWIKL